MVAAYHQGAGTLLATADALDAMRSSLDADAQKMAEAGVIIPGVFDTRMDMEAHLSRVFGHYQTLVPDPTPLMALEREIVVPIPSRSCNGRGSSLYRFQGFLDAMEDADGESEWLWEYKLRGKLTKRFLIELGRQHRWYAWARQRQTGRKVIGVKVVERLNDSPHPPKIVNGKRKGEKVVSADVAQLTTPALYLAACEEWGTEPNPVTLEMFRRSERTRWQQVVAIPFRPSELAEAGQELVSAAKLIRDLDRGDLYPIRNAKGGNCNGCDFRAICLNPRDDLYVEQLFKRSVPKRLRPARDGNGSVDGAPAVAMTLAAGATTSTNEEEPF